MGVKVYLEREKKKRTIGYIKMVMGIIGFCISIGLFATAEKYALPLFTLVVSIYMILDARQTLIID
ncbi:MAG: hypothetical protein QXG86_02135 [Candidatus Woesearchaeota archaeon]